VCGAEGRGDVVMSGCLMDKESGRVKRRYPRDGTICVERLGIGYV